MTIVLVIQVLVKNIIDKVVTCSIMAIKEGILSLGLKINSNKS